MRFRRKVLLEALKLFDLLSMTLCFGLATVMVSYPIAGLSLAELLSLRVKIINFILVLALLLVWSRIFSFFELYSSKRLSNQRDEVISVLMAVSIGNVALFIATLLFRIDLVTPLFLGVFWSAGATFLIVSRLVLRQALKFVRMHGRNVRRVLIIGTNPRAVKFARRLEASSEFGFHVIGFVDDEWAEIHTFRKTGYPLVGDLTDSVNLVHNTAVDEVVMALPLKSFYQLQSQLVDLCEELGILVRFPSDIYHLTLGRTMAEELGDDLVITLSTGATGWNCWTLVMKQLLDFSVSLVLITLLSPLFLVISVLLKLSSPGPIFFFQERVGLNKRRFRLYKFRTMVVDAERLLPGLEDLNEVDGPAFKIKNDPRITRIGKYLRKTSIDELPQLFNVLKGEMSLVGPRRCSPSVGQKGGKIKV